MHIDHDKLVELIADASGISAENIEKQISELIEEIEQAFEDGEAYEVEDFGVFSAMGNNVVFIPSDNLETEINYKYVGMEAIEVEGSDEKEAEEMPAEPVMSEEEEDPFAGLLDDADEDEDEDEVFGGLDAEESEEETEEESVREEDEDESEDIFPGDADELIPEETPGPEKWGIDTYKDDSAEGVFSTMMGEAQQDEEEEDEEEQEPEIISSMSADDYDDDAFTEESLLGGEEDFDEDFDDPFAELAKSARSSSADEDDQDEDSAATDFGLDDDDEDEEFADDTEDVFAGLDDLEDLDDDDEEESQSTGESEEGDFVPVVSNVSSDTDSKSKSSPSESKEKKEYQPRKRDKQSSGNGISPLVLVLILIIVGAGATWGLAYYGVINIEGITPAQSDVQLAQQPVQNIEPQPAATDESESEAAEPEAGGQDMSAENTVSPGDEAAAQETNSQENTSNVQQPEETDPQPAEASTELPSVAETGQDMYGLMGTAVAEANDGYTIVLYTLSNEENARREYNRLNNNGFRAIMQPRDSNRYGTLYRISIGQFGTLTDAAVAAEDLGDGIPENYIISRIN